VRGQRVERGIDDRADRRARHHRGRYRRGGLHRGARRGIPFAVVVEFDNLGVREVFRRKA